MILLKLSSFIIVLSCIILQACSGLLPGEPPEDEILDGQIEGLSYEQNRQFLAGDIAFNNDIFSPVTGLGPLFISTSCGTCHPGDGKGHPFTTFIRFGQTDSTGNHFLDMGGPQLQDRAIPGYRPETLPAGVTFSKFTPPANTGLGFLDAVPDTALISLSDPDDNDGDGISGVPNWITIPLYSTPRPGSLIRADGRYIGRFGKKASVYDLLQQTVNAYNQDIGITSSFEPADTYSGNIVEPEVDDNTIHDVVFYLKTLKAPIQRIPEDPEIMEGKTIFNGTGCASCHLPEMETGPSAIGALSFRKFSPYTDLLLHDMGPELDDGYTEGNAQTSEWRTPPLWGLGLSKNSQGGQYFLLHDGRAESIEDAILLHGGEGYNARESFRALSADEKQKLLKFLESL
jgi:CxxC motif-containing protein (DUF1111 family)